MRKLLEQDNLLRVPKLGEIVEGKVIAKESGRLFLDLDPIGTGIIYGKEFYEARDKIKTLKIGDNLFAKIIDLDATEEGYIELSITQAGMELALDALRQKKEKGEKILVKIMSANKGGLVTELMGIPAFLPVSQLLPEHYPKVGKGETNKILKELQKFIGKEMEVKILNFASTGGQIILSEKAKEIEKIKEILKNYKIGDVVDGEITGITDFGAFCKFGAEKLEGLIHISELDWKIVEDPTEIVKIGDKVQVKIIDISEDKIFLSLKALKKDPWQDIDKKYKKGDIVSGKVTKFNPFGAFVHLSSEEPAQGEDGERVEIQGLCHISEFGTKTKMEEKLKIGQEYQFQILEIKPKEHRLTLRLVPKNE